jgi:uncharacterized BrkB/YihY/UPF0761 family membrane protein
VTIILWSFFGAMLVLAGAEWAARKESVQKTEFPATAIV